MSGEGEAEVLDDLRGFIDTEVAAGFNSESEIAVSAVEVFVDDPPREYLTPIAQRMTHEAILRHLEEQRNWPEVTDCDRLDAGFAELNNRGIVAIQNAVCCQTCGAAQAHEECNRRLDAGSRIRGYTFYHEQDTESAAEGYGILLSYGSRKRWTLAHLNIAREVVRVLKSHGLNVTWSGKLNKRIVVDLKWQRRRSLP
ncbi:MAG: hypothetical protein ABL949_14360 [Fimbriimonadaceae bacterium]